MNTISKTPDPTIVYLVSVVLYSGGLDTNNLRCGGRGHHLYGDPLGVKFNANMNVGSI